MERLDAEGTKRFIDEHTDILDEQDNVFASSAFLKMFIEQIPAKRYFAQRLGDSVVLLEEKGTLSSCYVEQAMTVATVTTSPRDALMRFFRDLQSPVLRLQPLADTSDFLRLPGWYVRAFDCHENWYMPTQGMTYENYVAARPWKERDKKVRTWKGTVAIEPTETGTPAFLEVYTKSWKPPEPHPNFVPAFMRMCAREGWLRVSVARMDGKPIAVQFCIVRNNIAYFYKTAYDEDYKKLSAGLIAIAAMVKHVLDVDQVWETDFGTGGDAYKKQWVTHVRRRKGVVMCRLTHPVGLARALIEAAGVVRKRITARKQSRAQPGTDTCTRPALHRHDPLIR
jgi:hypothetical protein